MQNENIYSSEFKPKKPPEVDPAQVKEFVPIQVQEVKEREEQEIKFPTAPQNEPRKSPPEKEIPREPKNPDPMKSI